jgi:hypothetical protein
MRGGHDSHTDSVPGSGSLTFKWAPNLDDLRKYLRREEEEGGDFLRHSTIVVAMGIHDAEAEAHQKKELMQARAHQEVRIREVMAYLIRTGAANVIWRTAAFMDGANASDPASANGRVHTLNEVVIAECPPGISVVNFEAEMRLKSVGRERLRGDSKEHFGNIPRMVEIQTLTHELTVTTVTGNSSTQKRGVEAEGNTCHDAVRRKS